MVFPGPKFRITNENRVMWNLTNLKFVWSVQPLRGSWCTQGHRLRTRKGRCDDLVCRDDVLILFKECMDICIYETYIFNYENIHNYFWDMVGVLSRDQTRSSHVVPTFPPDVVHPSYNTRTSTCHSTFHNIKTTDVEFKHIRTDRQSTRAKKKKAKVAFAWPLELATKNGTTAAATYLHSSRYA